MDLQLELQLNNGQYIDDGNIVLRMLINSKNWETYRNGTTITLSPKLVNEDS